ncbi:hypothetical protein FQN50_003545 [Emmonsiellopsis sp. PD_5]|nr:hypothetical protein FQN50_003545 [Emmonsiellopsis sp. PD_5]
MTGPQNFAGFGMPLISPLDWKPDVEWEGNWEERGDPDTHLTAQCDNDSSDQKDKSITLVYHKTIGEWAHQLGQRLQGKGHTIEWARLENDISLTTPAKDVIFLLDLDGPFLDTMSEPEFDSLKRYISACDKSRVLWVTLAIQMQCDDPRYGLILGVARTVRTELQLDFATVEVDGFESGSLQATLRVYDQFCRQIDQGNRVIDFEYSVIKGVVYTGRLEWVSLAEQRSTFPQKDASGRVSTQGDKIPNTAHQIPGTEYKLINGKGEVNVISSHDTPAMIPKTHSGKSYAIGSDPNGIARLINRLGRYLKVMTTRKDEWKNIRQGTNRGMETSTDTGTGEERTKDLTDGLKTAGGPRIDCPETKFSFPPNSAYLLAGGLGGIGQAISTWMVEKGARHLIYLSRSAGNPEHSEFIKQLESQRCAVSVVTGSVSNLQDLEQAVHSGKFPVAGVINLSGATYNEPFAQTTMKSWHSILAPKVTGTWNLHNATKHLPLDFFLLFGSTSGICGSPTMVAYAAGNAFSGVFVQYRRQQGLPASVLDLGAMGEVGLVSKDKNLIDMITAAGMRLVTVEELLGVMEVAIRSPSVGSTGDASVASCVLGVGVSCTRPLSAPGVIPLWSPRDARFARYKEYEKVAFPDVPGDDELDKDADMQQFVSDIERNPACLDNADMRRRITTELWKMISFYMPAGKDDITDGQVEDVVFDPRISMAIRGWLSQKLAVDVGLEEISKYGTVGGLAGVAVAALKEKYTSNIDEAAPVQQ